MSNKSQILFVCSEELKTAMGVYAQKNNISLSELIRSTMAEKIGYDISNEQIVDGRRKYANDEERRKAQNARARSQRDVAKILKEAMEHEEHLAARLGIAESLLRKGIGLD